MARDMMTEEIYFRAAKLTLGQVEDQTVLVKTLKKGAEMITMLLHRSARDEDVIQVGKREVEATTHRVHQPLKGLRRVLQPERHAQKLKQPKRCDVGGFRDVRFVDRYLVVATHQIYL